MMAWFATVNEGFEDVASSELEKFGALNISSRVGKIFFKGHEDLMYILNYSSRTINRLFILLLQESVENLSNIYRVTKSIDFSEVIKPKQSFAVRAERVGKHTFTSMDIRKVVGQAIIDSYLDSKKVRLKVNLDNPDVEVYAFLTNNNFVLGINTTGESLHKRRYRVYDHPAALKTVIAASMLKLIKYSGEPLIDPMCGGGTIVIEAAQIVRKYPIFLFRDDYMLYKLSFYDENKDCEIRDKLVNEMTYPKIYLYGFDISPKHIAGAILNAISGYVADTINFSVKDSTLKETYSDIREIKFVVTNPPYGIRFFNHKNVYVLYREFLKVLKNMFPGIYIVAITGSHKEFSKAIDVNELKVIHERVVRHGNLRAKVFVVKT